MSNSHPESTSFTSSASSNLDRLQAVIESRKPKNGGDPNKSYVARLLHMGADSILKKIGEEATEVVIAAKDLEAVSNEAHVKAFVGEMADLWFHSMVALAHFDLSTKEVLNELARREGLSGLQEKALRKAISREHAQK